LFELRPILDYHGRMLADHERVERFAQAISAVVRPGDVVADVGCGTGIMSLLACRAGARRVFAIEVGPVGRLAERTVSRNDLMDRITIVKGLSTEVRLPEKVDVIVSETVGNAAFDEGIIGYLADARERFLAPGGRVIPRSLSLMVAPVRDLQLHERLVGAWKKSVAGFDLSPLLPFAAQQLHFVTFQSEQIASESRRAVTVDLERVVDPFVAGKIELELTADGPIAGFGLWFEAELADGVPLSSLLPTQTQSWSHGFLSLLEPIPAKRGDLVQLEIATHNGQTWRWRGRVAGRSFDLNTLAGRLFDASELRGDSHRAVLDERGQAAHAALALFDGHRTVAEVAQTLRGGSDERFPNEGAARAFVSRLARQFGT
jgi:enediyne biosynthesis protein CalE3